MKTRDLLSLALFGLFGLAAVGCGGMRAMTKDVRSAITLADLQTNPDKYAPRLEKPGDELIIAIKKGDSVPLELALDAPQVATLEAGQNRLRFTQDLFLAVSRDGVFVSKDGATWAQLGDDKALKELLGFAQGSVQAGLGATKEKGPFMSLGLTLK
ncbi:MAG: hypothetical protein PHU25_22610 [Deltaproteobacteria bacterium]|nr:hypothetical protein [Deltaproteobacteria bacterium]